MKINLEIITKLTMQYLENEFGGIPFSSMNKSGDDLFHSEFIKNHAFNGWFKEPTTENLDAYDYNKHYTSCFNGDEVNFGFPIYNIFDEVKPYTGKKIRCGYYYVENKNFFPFHGNGWYDADLIFYSLSIKLITKDDIKYQYISSNELKQKILNLLLMQCINILMILNTVSTH